MDHNESNNLSDLNDLSRPNYHIDLKDLDDSKYHDFINLKDLNDLK